MSSSGLKQVSLSAGYYITLADAHTTSYVNTGTESAPTMVAISTTNLGTANLTVASAVGSILRDEGKKLVSANRTFRKVQLLVSTGSVLTLGSDCVAGTAASATVFGPYISYYIELPSSALVTGTTPVARLG